MKETYETFKFILEKLQYSVYDWNICGDLKVVEPRLTEVSVNRGNNEVFFFLHFQNKLGKNYTHFTSLSRLQALPPLKSTQLPRNITP
jgi:hypothetical protein